MKLKDRAQLGVLGVYISKGEIMKVRIDCAKRCHWLLIDINSDDRV